MAAGRAGCPDGEIPSQNENAKGGVFWGKRHVVKHVANMQKNILGLRTLAQLDTLQTRAQQCLAWAYAGRASTSRKHIFLRLLEDFSNSLYLSFSFAIHSIAYKPALL